MLRKGTKVIERYNCQEMASIWTDSHKFSCFLQVEKALLNALKKSGKIEGDIAIKPKQVKINPERILEIEEKTKHDLIAFCSSITEQLDQKTARYFHYGVTSSDIIDSALSLQLRSAIDIILDRLSCFKTSLQYLISKSEDTLTIGRSHGIHAEPMILAQKWLGHLSEFSRRESELNDVKQELTAQFSGAVGNYSILTPEIEELAARELELKVEPVSTQIIPRDRIAKIISINARIATAIERLAIELRHLQRSEVSEVAEGFSEGQKGSSTMPHKKNPISSENLTGIARIVRSHETIALENIVSWHERDISHSSTERMYLPDNFTLLSYALKRMTSVINNLVIDKKRCEQHINGKDNFLSSLYLHQLIDNTELSRDEIYTIVQSAAFAAKKEATSLIEQLKKQNSDLPIKEIDHNELKAHYLKHYLTIKKRVIK